MSDEIKITAIIAVTLVLTSGIIGSAIYGNRPSVSVQQNKKCEVVFEKNSTYEHNSFKGERQTLVVVGNCSDEKVQAFFRSN